MKEKKPNNRPWILQMQWKSQVDFEKYSYKARNRQYKSEWENWFRKYANTDQAKEHLTNEIQDPNYEIYFIGRNWRLFNKETQEIVSIIMENKTITLI